MSSLPKTPVLAGCSGKISHFAAAVTVAAALAASSAFAQSSSPWTVVASGLNNPRGLDFSPNGSLYVAEAGTGGPAGSPELSAPEGGGMVRFGLSGSVTRVFKGTQTRIVTGLPSLAGPTGGSAIGPSDINFGQNGNGAFTIGLGRNPAARETLKEMGAAEAGLLGTLWQLNQNGQLKLLADLAGFEAAANPDAPLPADSNPNGVLSDRGGSTFYADAGGNSLVEVSASGKFTVVAVFPNRAVTLAPGVEVTVQAVPTNVVRGPDGALYVSQLTGGPFPPGAANIYRVVPGAAPQVFASGFTNIIDLEFDAAGNLYVLEIDANGIINPGNAGRLSVVRASNHQTVTVVSNVNEDPSRLLVMPGGLTIGPDGFIYVSNRSTSPGQGEVVRIPPAQL